MRITVLGGCGAWPEAGGACSGFLVEHEGFRVLLDLGYATFPRLLQHAPAESIDAVLISHGHPDHCADLNPLLRARALAAHPAPALPVFAPPGALDAVLALDRPGMLDAACELRALEPSGAFTLGPLRVQTRPLPHWLPDTGIRLSAGAAAVAYTGDCGPDPGAVALAEDAQLLIAEATYPEHVPEDSAPYLSSALQVGEEAAQAGVERLLLTHLWPGTSREESVRAARRAFSGPIDVAEPGLTIEL